MITQKFIKTNFDEGRNGKKPEFIVIHTYGAPGRSLYAYFNKPSSKVSAHYAVFKDGNGEQYVDELNTAYHAGSVKVNNISIGIEHQDDGDSADAVRTNELYETSAQLCADIYRKYGWDKTNQGLIKPHNEYVPTRTCPGGLDINRIRQRVYDILNTVEQIIYYNELNGDQIPILYKEADNSSIWNAHSEAEKAFHALPPTMLTRERVKLIKLNQTTNVYETLGDSHGLIDILPSDLELLQSEISVLTEDKSKLESALNSANTSNILLKADNKALKDDNEELKKNCSDNYQQLFGRFYLLIKKS